VAHSLYRTTAAIRPAGRRGGLPGPAVDSQPDILAVEIGLDETSAAAVLDSDAYTEDVREDITLARQFGATGVPFFVADRHYDEMDGPGIERPEPNGKSVAIVGSGPNAASPHHEPGDRVIGRDETVVCDFGGTLSLDGDVGYCSDITRTVVTGDPSPEVRACYDVLQAAQHSAVEAAVAGVTAASTRSRSMFRVAGSMSTKTGRAPTSRTTLLVATQESGVVMTSSPGPTPALRSAISIVQVPELNTRTGRPPTYSERRLSNSFT